jgi:hypothetical protein
MIAFSQSNGTTRSKDESGACVCSLLGARVWIFAWPTRSVPRQLGSVPCRSPDLAPQVTIRILPLLLHCSTMSYNMPERNKCGTAAALEGFQMKEWVGGYRMQLKRAMLRVSESCYCWAVVAESNRRQ